MVFGIPVHAALIYSNVFTNAAGLASMHFRMATFFLISGFFVSMVASRSSMRSTIMRRAKLLLIPFMAMLILVQPITFFLIRTHESGAISFIDFFIHEYHFQDIQDHLGYLWFLPALFTFVLLTPALRGPLRQPPVRRLADAMAGWPKDFVILAFMLATALATPVFLKAAGVAPLLFNGEFHWLARQMARYLPFFAVGVALDMNRGLLESLHRISIPALAIGAAFGLGWADPLMAAAGISPNGAELIARTVLTAAIVPALLSISRSLFTRHNRAVSALTNAIYSIYLFHYPILFAMALLIAPYLGDGLAAFFTNITLTFAAAFLLHHFVIARAPLLRLLFNGRPMREPRAAAAAAAVVTQSPSETR